MKLYRLLLIAGISVLLVACIRPYRMEIQQGNLTTEKEVAQLERGMSKREVRYIMGTPLVVDPFHQNRWDYFYSYLGSRDRRPEQRRITVVFTGDVLDRLEGDVVAAADVTSALAEEPGETGGTRVTEPPEKKKKGVLKRVWEAVWPGAGDPPEDAY